MTGSQSHKNTVRRSGREAELKSDARKHLTDRSSEPSALVRRFGRRIVEAAKGAPILDVGCGAGRNAIYLAQLGGTVICIDKNFDVLRELPRTNRIVPLYIDLAKDRWPFAQSKVGGIISVHFLMPELFPRFESSLSRGGGLLIETVPGHGGNYLELPRQNQLSRTLKGAFRFEFYREKKAGPASCEKVTVRLFAWRRDAPLRN